jgi:hypothetical protein
MIVRHPGMDCRDPDFMDENPAQTHANMLPSLASGFRQSLPE